MACSLYDFTAVHKDLRENYFALSQRTLDETFWESLTSLTFKVIYCAQEALRQYVPELFSHPLRVAVAYTGSDSRLEKCGLGSPFECIVIFPMTDLSAPQGEIVKKISKMCSEGGLLFCPHVEVKRLDHDLVSTYLKENGVLKNIPTRAFDAAFLGGDLSTFLQYKRKLFDELAQGLVDLKSFRKGFLDQSLQSLRQELSGSPHKAPLLTLDSGTVFYEKNGRRGLKHDILRAVQYSVAYVIFGAIQKGILTFNTASVDIPRTVIERLEWFRQKKFASLQDAEYSRLIRNYTQVSYWYVRLNEISCAVMDPRKVVTMVLDPQELRPILKETLELSKKIKNSF